MPIFCENKAPIVLRADALDAVQRIGPQFLAYGTISVFQLRSALGAEAAVVRQLPAAGRAFRRGRPGVAAMPAEARIRRKGLAAVGAGSRGRFFLEDEILRLCRGRPGRAGIGFEGVRRTAVGVRLTRSSAITETEVQRKAKAAEEQQGERHAADIEQDRSNGGKEEYQREYLPPAGPTYVMQAAAGHADGRRKEGQRNENAHDGHILKYRPFEILITVPSARVK